MFGLNEDQPAAQCRNLVDVFVSSFLSVSSFFFVHCRPPPTNTTSIQLKYVTITEWQLDTQWPVRTLISQCFILVRSQTAEKISKLFQGLESDQTFLASPLTRPLIYNGSVRGWLDTVCLKTYRCSSIAQAFPLSVRRVLPISFCFSQPARLEDVLYTTVHLALHVHRKLQTKMIRCFHTHHAYGNVIVKR